MEKTNKSTLRSEAIKVLELKRHFNPNYTKGDKGNIRHFISHEEDPFTEEEIESQIKWHEYIQSLPPVKDDITKLRNIKWEWGEIEENDDLPF